MAEQEEINENSPEIIVEESDDDAHLMTEEELAQEKAQQTEESVEEHLVDAGLDEADQPSKEAVCDYLLGDSGPGLSGIDIEKIGNEESQNTATKSQEAAQSTVTLRRPEEPGYLGIGFALTEPFSNAIEAMATDQGISPSDVCRDLVLQILQNYMGVRR